MNKKNVTTTSLAAAPVGRRSLLKTAAGITVAGLAPALFPRAANAVLKIDITRGNVDPLPVAVTDLFADTDNGRSIGQNITRVVAADLERSGLFRPLPANIFLQRPEDMQLRPRFPDWRQINAQALVTGRVALEVDGRL